MDRNTLFEMIYAGRTRLESVLQKLTPDQFVDPSLPGGWSMKDLLAHLGWWEQHVQDMYRDAVAGEDPGRENTAEDIDHLNARIRDMYRPWDLDRVREFERGAYDALLAMIESAPDENLFDPNRFGWTNGQPFVYWIAGNTYGHYDEHWNDIERLAQDAGIQSSAVRLGGEFLDREGRDIDQALYGFAWRGLKAEDVLAVLNRYQNVDGGFSRLEFDIAAPQSTAFATDLALRVLLWIDPPRDHPVVQKTVAYLEAVQDEGGNYPFAPEVYQYQLASWFKGWQWPNISPSLQIAGALKQLGLGSNRLHQRVQNLFGQQAKPDDLTGNEFYTAVPYAVYFQTEWDFPEADFYRWGLVWWMVRQHYANPGLDATHFLELAPRPDSAVARRLPETVLNAKLDQLLAEQSVDGGWPSPYDPHWRTWITANNLLTLRAYGKI